jgi:hypothetical protein
MNKSVYIATSEHNSGKSIIIGANEYFNRQNSQRVILDLLSKILMTEN